MIGWIMREVRLIACLLSLFIIFNGNIYAMTAVQENERVEAAVTKNDKVSSRKGGVKNKSWSKVRNVVNAGQKFKQQNDSSKISQNDPEDDFDDTKTIFEEDEELNDTADIKSEEGGLKRSDSNMTLYDESINSGNDENTKSEKAESKNESAQSGSRLLSVMKARQKLKNMATNGDQNDQRESDSDGKREAVEKSDDSKKDIKSDLDEEDDDEIEDVEDIKSEKTESKSDSNDNKATEEKDVDLKKDIKSDSNDNKATKEKDVDTKKDEKTDSDNEKTNAKEDTNQNKGEKPVEDEKEDHEIDSSENKKSEKTAIKIPKVMKFPLQISGIKKSEEVSSASPSYRRVYRDNDPEAYETPTIRRRYSYSAGDNRYSINRTGDRRSSLEGTLRRSLDFSSLQKNLNSGNGDENSQDQQADDSENETKGEETSTPDVSRDVMPMTNTPLPMQQPDQTMMPSMNQNLVANGNMNNQMVMQQSLPVTSGNIQNNNTNPSFGESFLQNLFHTNQSNQNTSNSETKTKRGGRNRFISGIQNAYGIGEAGVQNMYGGVREAGRNLKDSEVVEKVIRYLRDLGVINESKFLKLNLKDIGTCIYCKKFSLLTMLNREKKLGVCKNCSEQIIGDYLSGRSLGGDRYAANGYRRDNGVDIADDMVRGGINELKKEGSLEKTLSLGNIAAALGTTILNKGSSANPNEQMGQNAFGQPLVPGALPPGQIAGGGIIPGQPGVMDPQLMNQPGMPGGAMPLDQMQTLNSGALVGGGAGALVGGAAALGQASNLGMMGQTPNLGGAPAVGTALGTANTSNMSRFGKIALGALAGTAVLGAGVAAFKALKSKGKGSTEQMVLNEKGELVPLSSWNNANAPYGYKIVLVPAISSEEGQVAAQKVATAKGVTVAIGQVALDANGELAPLSSFAGTNAPYGYKIILEPATSLEEGLASAQSSSQNTEPMVLNSIGQLIPLSALAGTDTPFGYKTDPVTGKLVPATSLEEGLAASNAFKASQEASSSKLKTAAKIAAGVAAGAAVAGAGVAAYKAWKKSKADKAGKGAEEDTDNAKPSGESDKKDTDTAKKDDSSKESSSEAQKDAPKELSPEEKEKAKKNIENWEKKIKRVQEGIDSTNKSIKEAEEDVKTKKERYNKSNSERDQKKVETAEKKLESLKESLKIQETSLEELKKEQEDERKKLNGGQSKSESVTSKTDESKSETGKAA